MPDVNIGDKSWPDFSCLLMRGLNGTLVVNLGRQIKYLFVCFLI